MTVETLSPLAIFFRCLCFIPFFAGGYWANRFVLRSNSKLQEFFLSLTTGVSWLLVSTAFVSRWTHRLDASVWLASTLTLLALIFCALKWGIPKMERVACKISPWHVALLLYCLLFLCFVGRAAWRFSFHDQMTMQAHPPLIASLVRGNIPPALISFPDIPLKYHWGGDLLGALYAWATGAAAYRAVDFTMIFGCFAWLGTLAVYCRSRRLSAALCFLAIVWLTLGAGWGYWIGPRMESPDFLRTTSFAWPGSQKFLGRNLNPGIIWNFYMTPYSLGFSLFFSYLTLIFSWLERRSFALGLLAGLVLTALSFVQVTFFLSLLSVTGLVLFIQWLREKPHPTRWFVQGAFLATLALILAVALGGFFTHSSGYSSGLLKFNWPPGYLKNVLVRGDLNPSFIPTMAWYFSTLGSLVLLSLPALGYAAVLSKKEKNPILIFFLLYALECFLVLQFFRYQLSWDIIKWFTGFQFAVILLILWLVQETIPLKRLALALLVPLIFLDCYASVPFLWNLGGKNLDQFEPSNRVWLQVRIFPPQPEISWLLQQVAKTPQSDILLAPKDLSDSIARYSGQAMALYDSNTIMFGVRPEILQKRNEDIQKVMQSFSMDALRESGIRWVVYPCGDFEEAFSPQSRDALQRAVAQGELSSLPAPSNFPCMRIFHR